MGVKLGGTGEGGGAAQRGNFPLFYSSFLFGDFSQDWSQEFPHNLFPRGVISNVAKPQPLAREYKSSFIAVYVAFCRVQCGVYNANSRLMCCVLCVVCRVQNTTCVLGPSQGSAQCTQCASKVLDAVCSVQCAVCRLRFPLWTWCKQGVRCSAVLLFCWCTVSKSKCTTTTPQHFIKICRSGKRFLGKLFSDLPSTTRWDCLKYFAPMRLSWNMLQ